MNPLNEPNPSDIDKKLEADIDTRYRKALAMEQEKQEAEIQSKVANEYENVRKLGFATKKDIDEIVAGVAKHYEDRITALEKQFEITQERMLRAAARGINIGKTEDETSKKEESALKAWERPFTFEPRRR